MSTDFQPQNELERQLLAAHQGELPPERFMEILLGSEVFMPVYDKYQIGGLVADTKARPLTLKDEQGAEVLVLFTNPERAKGFVKDYPGYGGGLVVELSWILERVGVGFGIALNPGLEVGLDIEAGDLAALASLGGERPH